MKFLIFSDVHSNENEKLFSYLDENIIDLVIITGDITNFGPIEFVNSFIGKILEYDVDVVAIPGNCDPEGVCEAITEASALCLHNQIVGYGDTVLFGYGGSNETPFDTPGEVTDEQLEEDLLTLLSGYECSDEPKVNILVTHAPPFETNADLIEGGVHVGSKGVLKAIQEFKPDINVCGHIHEAKSVDLIGETKILNPGMLENDGAILIDIEDGNHFTSEIIQL
ncbi:MAG: metallophosphoesterase [archaeon]|nr:metallophosphoesterase [archaeon]